jgi:hypothetical protein
LLAGRDLTDLRLGCVIQPIRFRRDPRGDDVRCASVLFVDFMIGAGRKRLLKPLIAARRGPLRQGRRVHRMILVDTPPGPRRPIEGCLTGASVRAELGDPESRMAPAATSHYAVVVGSPRSVRFDDDVLSRLDRYVREHAGTSSSSVANMFVDESLRAYEHPGIVFRPGPTGRRAALSGGPDVWEVVTALHAVRVEEPGLDGQALVTEVAAVTGLSPDQVGVAVRYYAAYPEEIDERIASNTAVAEREERLWAAQQSLLRRTS